MLNVYRDINKILIINMFDWIGVFLNEWNIKLKVIRLYLFFNKYYYKKVYVLIWEDL